MTQEPQKNNTILIVIAVIGVFGTIVASIIGAMANYNIEKERQGFELTRIALVSIATQGGATQLVLENTVNAPTKLPESTYTPPPTYTPFPTLPPTSTATLFVPPADGILFQDNFDTTMSPDWIQLGGTWLVSDGQLTMLADDGNIKWIALRKPEWKNYIISVKINFTYTELQYPLIAVRTEGTQSKYIGVPVLTRQLYWAFIGSDDWDSISGENEDFKFTSGSTVELQVEGDTYTLRVNGREIQTITIAGYSSGGISLGLTCTYNCPSFDNVKVTYLP